MKQTAIFDMCQTIFKPTGNDRMTTNGATLPIEAIPHALETFLSFLQQGFQVVIISSADTQSSRDRLQFLLQEYGIDQEEIKQLLKEIDILSMQFYGSKNTKEAWLEAMKPYKNIAYIFEDGEAKLHAAGEAARELGSDPELFTSVAEYVEGV